MSRTGTEPVGVACDDVVLAGDLAMPAGASAAVVFAHGSGSGRASPRNRRVAAALQEDRLGTLLVDLLTDEEAARDALTAELSFDIELLTRRRFAAPPGARRSSRRSSRAGGGPISPTRSSRACGRRRC